MENKIKSELRKRLNENVKENQKKGGCEGKKCDCHRNFLIKEVKKDLEKILKPVISKIEKKGGGVEDIISEAEKRKEKKEFFDVPDKEKGEIDYELEKIKIHEAEKRSRLEKHHREKLHDQLKKNLKKNNYF